jgi:hypothetical protein
MSVVDHDTVDAVSITKDRSTIVLTISDHLAWGEASDVHIDHLSRKLETYLTYVASGQLDDAFPDYSQLKKRIEIFGVLPEESNRDAWHVIDNMRIECEKFDIALVYNDSLE